jgi:hypothetical protein
LTKNDPWIFAIVETKMAYPHRSGTIGVEILSMIYLSVYWPPDPTSEWLLPILQGMPEFSGLRMFRPVVAAGPQSATALKRQAMLSGYARLLTEVLTGMKSTAERLERIE